LGTRLGWHSKLGAAALLKAVWWDFRLADGLVLLFVCTVMDFSAAEKDRGVKFCMCLGLLSRQVFSSLEVKGQSHQGQKRA